MSTLGVLSLPALFPSLLPPFFPSFLLKGTNSLVAQKQRIISLTMEYVKG